MVIAADSSRPDVWADSTWKVSRYTLVSSASFAGRDGTGDAVRLVWNTFSGKTIVVGEALGRQLAEGSVAGLSPRIRNPLIDAHVIVPTDENELQGVLDRLRTGAADPRERVFVLMPTAACNMSCSYCGQLHRKGDPGEEHRDRIRRRVKAAIADPQIAKIAIRWFGGEPLLGYRHIIEMGRAFRRDTITAGKLFESRIVTNGALLTCQRAIELHRQAGIGLIIITIDGPGEVHNSRRPTKSGLSTFDRIMGTLQEILRSPETRDLRIQLRSNIDVHNVDRMPEYLQTCAGLGLGDPRVLFELAPIHSWGNDADSEALSPDDFARHEVELFELMFALGLNFPPLPSQPRRLTCPAVTRSAEIISPTGAVFSCTEKPLVPAAERLEALIQLAGLADSELRPLGPYDDWNDSLAAGETWCRDCPMLGVCGGACPKLWRESGPPCPSFKRNWDARLSLAATQAGLLPVAVSMTGADDG